MFTRMGAALILLVLIIVVVACSSTDTESEQSPSNTALTMDNQLLTRCLTALTFAANDHVHYSGGAAGESDEAVIVGDRSWRLQPPVKEMVETECESFIDSQVL